MKSSYNLGNKFNYEKEVSLSIELNKTCYSKGELLKGTIILTPKQNSTITELLNPYAVISFQEKQSYQFLEVFQDKDRDIMKPTKKNIEEINNLGSCPMNFSNFANAKMVPFLKIPFQINIPYNAYPSCFFEKDCYVVHFLTCEFESLQVKKSVMIIIKNNYYFSQENKLLKIPTIEKKTITKHKLALISCGFFEVKITLEKNICPYNDNLPIVIDIDCSRLKNLKIKGVKMYIYRSIRKNAQQNKNLIKEEKTEEIMRKTLPLKEGEIMYHVEDGIKLPLSSNDLNPEEVYKKLDNDKRQGNTKFENIKLYPSCSGGLLSCQYFIKVLIETGTLFSTNEELQIPIDYYSPFDNNEDIGGFYDNVNNNNNNENIKEEKIKEDINNEIDIESNLNINQQVFVNETKSSKVEKKNENKKENKKSKNNIDDFQILPDDDDE